MDDFDAAIAIITGKVPSDFTPERLLEIRRGVMRLMVWYGVKP